MQTTSRDQGEEEETKEVKTWCGDDCASSSSFFPASHALDTISRSSIFRCALWTLVLIGCVVAFRTCRADSTGDACDPENSVNAAGAFLLGWIYLAWRWALLSFSRHHCADGL